LWGAAVYGGSAHAHGGRMAVHVAAGRGTAGVVGGDGESFVLGVNVVLGFVVDFGERHGAAGAYAASCDAA
jgi:hypothetical protein